MIVYGDHPNPRHAREYLADLMARADGDPRALLIDFGQLQQAVLDHAWRARGGLDDWGPLEQALARTSLILARRLAGAAHDVRAALASVRTLIPDEVLEMKTPGGYAYYGLYPDFYLTAARRWRSAHPDRPVCVIGLRSIGTGLAAAVAAGLGEARLPVTLRPAGHAFMRTPALTPTLTSFLCEQPAEVHFALVDEGPGLSGSSLGGVADWLEDHGVAPERVHVFCGHAGGLGPRAQARHRARWDRTEAQVFDLDHALAAGRAQTDRLEDVSGGAWRRHLFACESAWPAVWRAREARKFLLKRPGRATLFAKFNGLDARSRQKFARARALGDAGFSPRVRGLRKGFVVQDWLGDAQPLPVALPPRARVVGRVAEYLIFRARNFTVRTAAHAPDELASMTRNNFAKYFAPAALADDGEFEYLSRQAARQPWPVHTDGRLHQWEWLVTADGRLLKTDAVDHGAAHDCVGAQDLAWDVVGALYEFDLNDAEFDLLLWMVKSAVPASALGPEKLRFFRYAYLAFQLGLHVTAADQAAGDAGEWVRLKARTLKYAHHLTELVAPRLGRVPALRLCH